MEGSWKVGMVCSAVGYPNRVYICTISAKMQILSAMEYRNELLSMFSYYITTTT